MQWLLIVQMCSATNAICVDKVVNSYHSEEICVMFGLQEKPSLQFKCKLAPSADLVPLPRPRPSVSNHP
jgi:hypothetical protein